MVNEPVDGGDIVTQDDKLWGALCWVPFVGWIVSILVLLMEDKRDRPFVKYHAVQSLALNVIAGVISGILSVVVIGCFVFLAWNIYLIYLAIQAYQGEWVEIPFITDFCKNQGWV